MTVSSSSSPEPLAIAPGATARGAARLPPSKSLTNRAYAIAMLASAPVTVEHPLAAEDTRRFLDVLERLGYGTEVGPAAVTIRPPARLPDRAELDCGASGTLLRFLVGACAALPGEWRIDGTPRLRERPVGPLAAALSELGAGIRFSDREGYAPLVVRGGRLRGGRVKIDAGDSSQYLSALLLAAQRAEGPVEIEVSALASAPYVELTVDLLERFGGRVEHPRPELWIGRPGEIRGGTVAIEPDLSAGAYPAAAAALTGGDLLLEGVRLDSRQGDVRFLALLESMGATVAQEADGVRVRGHALRAVDVDLSRIPDQVPTLAALAPFALGTTAIRNVAHLRLKESDRLAAMASELARAGAPVVERPDGLEIDGVWAEHPPPSAPVAIDAHDDHRIAMSMALVGLRRPGLSIRDPRVVAKSWPGYWEAFRSWTESGAEER